MLRRPLAFRDGAPNYAREHADTATVILRDESVFYWLYLSYVSYFLILYVVVSLAFSPSDRSQPTLVTVIIVSRSIGLKQ
jgi:hypothetical protein